MCWNLDGETGGDRVCNDAKSGYAFSVEVGEQSRSIVVGEISALDLVERDHRPTALFEFGRHDGLRLNGLLDCFGHIYINRR